MIRDFYAAFCYYAGYWLFSLFSLLFADAARADAQRVTFVYERHCFSLRALRAIDGVTLLTALLKEGAFGLME